MLEGGCTADETAGGTICVLAGPGVIGVQQGAYHRATLVVATCALAAGAAELLVLVAAAGTIVFVFVFGTGARGSAAGLGDVAFTGAGTADSVGGGELAFAAAAVVRVVADGTVFEFAGLGIAAGVVAAAFFVAAVAFLVAFDDAVAALTAANGHDAAVIR